MGGVFSSKANTVHQESGSKRPRDDAPAPQKQPSLRAEKRAERGAVLLTPWGQALTKAADALRRWHRDDDGADPFAPPPKVARPTKERVLALLKGATRERLGALTVSQLKELCRCVGTRYSVPKAQLIENLLDPAAHQKRSGAGPPKYGDVDNHAPTEERDGVMSPGRSLPTGWESRVESKTGREFFVDHNAKRTTWSNPLEDPTKLSRKVYRAR